jgi:hypothetical protein
MFVELVSVRWFRVEREGGCVEREPPLDRGG